jgi:hypothetical protein
MDILEDKYRSEELFGDSKENLQQIPARFSSSTLGRIEDISEAHGISKASVIRKLVSLGLEKVKNL